MTTDAPRESVPRPALSGGDAGGLSGGRQDRSQPSQSMKLGGLASVWHWLRGMGRQMPSSFPPPARPLRLTPVPITSADRESALVRRLTGAGSGLHSGTPFLPARDAGERAAHLEAHIIDASRHSSSIGRR